MSSRIFLLRRTGILFLVFAFFLGSLFSQGNLQQEVRKYAVVIKDANIRNMPSVQGEIIYLARAGEKLEVLDDLGTWLKVKVPSVGTGFVWSQLVRIEVVKIIKPVVPPPKPTSPPAPSSPKPAMKPSPQPQRAKFGLSFNFNYALVSPDDFNANIDLFNGILSELQPRYPDSSVDHPLEKLNHLLGGGVEGKFLLNPNVALSLGFTYLWTNKSTSTTLTAGSTKVFGEESTLKATIFAPYVGVNFIFPSSLISLEFFADAGYFMGNFYQTHDVWKLGPFVFDEMKKSTPGFMGGLRLNINLHSNIGVFMAGKYTLVKFKDIPGKLTAPGSVYKTGTVYYYKQLEISHWYPSIWVYDTLPSPIPPWMKSPRKAEFDFSGLYLGAGFFFKF